MRSDMITLILFNADEINADENKPNGESHEIFISDDYFLIEENFD